MKNASRIVAVSAALLTWGCGEAPKPAVAPSPTAAPQPAEEPKPEPPPEPAPMPIPEGWIELDRPEGFKVHFPAEPTAQDLVIPLDTGGTQKMVMLLTNVGETQYTLTASDVTPSRGDRSSKEFLDAARGALATKIGAKVTEEKEVDKKDQAGEPLAGREWLLHHEKGGLWLRVVVYLCDNDSFQILVAAPTKDTQKDFEAIRDSFRLMKTCKTKW